MKNTLKINHTNSTIVMDRTFAKLAENTMSAEYAHLQQVRKDYPAYTVVRRTIKRNANKESYKGLTYEYFRLGTFRNQIRIRTELVYVPGMVRILPVSFCHHNPLLDVGPISVMLTC